jgi:tRNA A-37 threonylcarbamoyl transferase component Bud32
MHLLLVLLFFLIGPVWAQDRGLLEIVTDPPGATIVQVGTGPIGKSGEVLTIEWDQGEKFFFQIDLEEYHSQEIEIERISFPVPPDTLRRPRDSGAIKLIPKDRLILLRPYRVPIVIVLGLVLFAGGRYGLRTSRELKRARILKRYEESNVKGGSLLWEQLGPYMLVDVLGRGGMSTVYKGVPVESLDEEKAVAVKVLSADLLHDSLYLERFQREVEISKNLVHPNIARLLDYGETNERLYLVQEFLAGGDLRAQVSKDGLPPERALEILEPIFSALSYAHRAGIVHRDLKPENIMLDANGRLRVTDFGLAKAEDSEKLTKTGVCMGTPAYMAPEQIQENELDPATDQYALGAMTFELLSGRIPFGGDDTIKVIFKHLTEPPPSLSALKPELGPKIDDVFSKMMAKKPSQRYPSTDDALAALQSALEVF